MAEEDEYTHQHCYSDSYVDDLKDELNTRIAELEKALRELRSSAYTKDGTSLAAYIDGVLSS